MSFNTSSSPQGVAIAEKSNGSSFMDRICISVVMALIAVLFIQTSMAQQTSHAECRVVSKIVPSYPDIARRNRIKGVVKLEVVVCTNESVQSTKVLGGSPALIESATDAVNKWKFEPAREETTDVVLFEFDN